MTLRSTVWLIGIIALLSGLKTTPTVGHPEYAQDSFSAQQSKNSLQRSVVTVDSEPVLGKSPHVPSDTSARVPIHLTYTPQIQLIAHREESPSLHQHADAMSSSASAPEKLKTLSLEELEGLAISNNPMLVQTNAQLNAERGAAFQAGLPFNPVVVLRGQTFCQPVACIARSKSIVSIANKCITKVRLPSMGCC